MGGGLLSGAVSSAGLCDCAEGNSLSAAGVGFVRELAVGETRSYGEVAAALGCGSARAVGQALGRNPLLLLIPCHRVIGAHGQLGGYAGGLARKCALLALEGVREVTLGGHACGGFAPSVVSELRSGDVTELAE